MVLRFKQGWHSVWAVEIFVHEETTFTLDKGYGRKGNSGLGECAVARVAVQQINTPGKARSTLSSRHGWTATAIEDARVG